MGIKMSKINQPLVTIAIIAYNQEEFIEEAVLSACEQDYENLEVIVSDDGSSDNTPEIILRLQNQYPNKIKAITGEGNLGITGNCNRALVKSTGEYLVFMGGDDVLFPSKVSLQVEWLLASENRVLCGHFIENIDQNGNVKGIYKTIKKRGIGADLWIRKGVLYGALSIMLKKSSIPQIGFDSRIKHASDWKFYIDCIGVDGEYGYIPEVLGRYRQHENNITKQQAIVMQDAESTLSILELEYPLFSKSIRYSKAFILVYGRGVLNQQEGNKSVALSFYFNSIKLRPTLYKSYFRILSLLFKL